MADDEFLIPTRDTSNNAVKLLTSEAAQQRRLVTKYSRDELEDKYLRMYEDHIVLKKHARKQEEKIKKMATKLLRLVNDKKKVEGEAGKSRRDVESEEKMEEMMAKIRDMEKQNTQLKEKLLLAKQQLSSKGSKRGTYPNIQARINTKVKSFMEKRETQEHLEERSRVGSERDGNQLVRDVNFGPARDRGLPQTKTGSQTVMVDPRLTKNLRVVGPPVQHEHPLNKSSPAPRYGHSILEATRAEKSKLEDQVASLGEQIHIYEMENENLRERMKLKEAEFDEDILKIKQQITSEQKLNLQENIDMIKLQREVKEKATMLIALQDKYQHLEESSRAVKQSHDQILREMEHLNLQFQEEQNRNLGLQNELKMASTNQKKALELQEQVTDLQKECEVLREANEKLVSSAFDLEREREWRQKENALKVQIAQLEATLKSDLGEKGSIIDRYATERDSHEKLQTEHRELQIEYFSLKEQMDDLNEKMKFFTKESTVDFTEIEEALVLIKQKKQREQKPPDFLQAVDDELNKDHKRALIELQAEYAETVHELEKTRNMLVVQHKINKDYQTEIGLSSTKMEELKKEYEMKLEEYARLLDIRAARIKKLEAQLRDVAYGTKQYRIPPPVDDDVESSVDFDETVSLERGQNLFEIHIEKVNLSKDALQVMGDEEPSLFCTWEFFEFEIQSTPVVRGSRPVFDFTSQYIVKVDDFFLHHLQKEKCTLEIHQSFGQDYSTVAVCQLRFSDIFDKPHGRIHGSATLTGMADGETGIGYGTLDYWVRLRVPMEQALRLYKERTKALGYLMTNERMATQALEALDETAAQRPPDNVNELHIKVIRCSKLQPRRQNVQPSPYCAYKLLDFPDHDTVILRNTNQPEFNDHKIYSVPVTFELDQYLRTAKLQMFIFDDTDPEVEAYLGVAEIPLLPLAHNNSVTGEFQLTRGTGKVPAGVIEVELRWQYHYLPPKVPKHQPQELEMAPDEPPQRLVSSDHIPTRDELVTPPRPHIPRDRARTAPMGPSATSTPLDRNDNSRTIDGPVVAESMPKPASRRRVQISHQEPDVSRLESDETRMAPSSPPPSHAVDDTVSQVVSGFMPSLSESAQESQDLTTLSRTEELEPVDAGLSTMTQDTEEAGLSTQEMLEGESEEGEELRERPTPPRSSFQIESGSEEEPSRRRKQLKFDNAHYHNQHHHHHQQQHHHNQHQQHHNHRQHHQPSSHRPVPKARTPNPKKRDPFHSKSGTITPMSHRSQSGAEEAPVEEEELEEDIDEEITEEVAAEEEGVGSTLRDDVGSTLRESEEPPMSSARQSEVSEESEPAVIESDSEGVMMVQTPPSTKQRTKKPKGADIVTIVISELSLEEDSPPMLNNDVKQLFVEYRFYDVDPENTETPFSLPKPRPDQSIAFNFSNSIQVDMKHHYKRREYLASMLLPDHPDKGRIKFTVVSEPPELATGESAQMECEDVGAAYVSLRDMLAKGKDLRDQNIDILNPEDESHVIGQMMVTVTCVDVLKAVEGEMQIVGTY